MSEAIPEEVMIAAQDVVDTLSCTDDSGHEWQLVIALALLARDERAAKEEREACAKVADNYPYKGQGISAAIAIAIRNRGKT